MQGTEFREKYYSDKSNFVSVTATCVNIGTNEHVLGEKEAQIEEKLTAGTIFTFISAPEYFGDGYDCPIVGLEVGGEVLLDFDTGYENLMETYEN